MKNKTQRIFIPGDKWVYYKVYCGVQTADKILIECVANLVKELRENEWISKWFFIRYTDSDHHFRIRFLLKNKSDFDKVINTFFINIKPYIDSKQIWKVDISSYERELERYGSNTIEEIETLFTYDSEYVLWLLSNTDSDSDRFIEVFNYIEIFISHFDLTDQQKLYFLDQMLKSYQEEFRVETIAKKRMSAKYRQIEKSLVSSSSVYLNNSIEMNHIIKTILQKQNTETPEIPSNDLMASCIHMTINRLFTSNQRLYELLLYDFLYRKNITQYFKNQ